MFEYYGLFSFRPFQAQGLTPCEYGQRRAGRPRHSDRRKKGVKAKASRRAKGRRSRK